MLPTLHAETTEAEGNPAFTALDLALTLAFRSGLRAPPFVAPYAHLTPKDVPSLAHTIFSKERIVVVGTGIDSGLLSKLVSHPFFALRRRTSADEVLRRRDPRNGRCWTGTTNLTRGDGGEQP